MIEWKEREHEFDDMAALQDPQVREALQKLWFVEIFQATKHEEISPFARVFDWVMGQ
jgi:hypothetical protein